MPSLRDVLYTRHVSENSVNAQLRIIEPPFRNA
jgi:hypothetical protein